MPIKGKRERRRYQRQWLQRRRQSWIDSKGGACKHCGRRDALQVDHIDPTTKVSHRVWSWSSDRREAELAKCQVLCRRCHGLKGRKSATPHTICHTTPECQNAA